MQGPHKQQACPEQQTTEELVRRIRKFRWLGMEREAQTLAEELVRRSAREMATVISQSRETD
jgi:hypothetical protein